MILDLRKIETGRHREQLVGCLTEPRVVVIRAHVPLDELLELPEWQAFPLVGGPSAFYQALCPAGEAVPLLDPLRQQHARLLELYPEMVARALVGEVEFQTFTELLLGHLEYEEDRLFAKVEAWTGEPRLARELGYDHQGLRRGLERLPDYLARVARQETTKKERDAFEIDFFHHFEHHYQREEEGLYPLLECLATARGEEL